MVINAPRYRLTADQYQEMGRLGIFPPDARVELLDGEVIEMSPIGRRHNAIVARLNHWLVHGVGDRGIVQVQGSFRMNDRSEPEPDLLVLKPRDDFYIDTDVSPAEVLLLIEVSETSVQYDRLEKLPRYAANGVPEVWLIDLPKDTLEVHRDPSPTGYRDSQRYTDDTAIAPQAFPDLVTHALRLLGRENTASNGDARPR